jgi:hypothetical protein
LKDIVFKSRRYYLNDYSIRTFKMTHMKQTVYSLFIFGILFSACGSDAKKIPSLPNNNTATTSNTTGQQTNNVPPQDSANPLQQKGFTYPAKPVNATTVPANQPTAQPAAQPVTQTIAQTNPASKTIPVAAATAKGMNPPHGQPGHRCDISVGAPLNSKPVATNVPQQKQVITNQPVTMQPTKPSAPVVTLPGMNPPHGQPGHRCDISVGAPLNSAPPKKDSL